MRAPHDSGRRGTKEYKRGACILTFPDRSRKTRKLFDHLARIAVLHRQAKSHGLTLDIGAEIRAIYVKYGPVDLGYIQNKKCYSLSLPRGQLLGPDERGKGE